VLFDGDRPVAGFPRGDAFALGVDGEALDELIREAEQTRSDALVVLKDHQIVAERSFGSRRGPIETMSVTKSITALAVMMLIEDGKIRSLDEPVGRFIPEFSRGKRASITLRHLLTQTSGLAHQKDAKTLNSQKDRTAFARKAEPADEPGSTFSYNNSATQLLSVVVASAAGKPVDTFLDQRLFRPLGIRGWQWARDEGKNVQTYYGLALEALDLARIGQLLLDQGRSGEQQLLSAASIQQLHTPGPKNPSYGLLWWIRYERVVHELDPAALARHEALTRGPLGELGGRVFPSAEALWMEAGARLSPEARGAIAALAEGGSPLTRTRPDHPVGFYADGSLGQRLAIFPEQRLVVVRQRRRRPAAEESEALSFPKMLKLAQALARPPGETPD
jgi:CubicO group peptidase (beta-lactamase class C family)